MVGRVLAAVVALGACGRVRFDGQPLDDARMTTTDTGGQDDSLVVVPPDARACFGGGLFEVCPQAPIAVQRTLTGTIDTDTSNLCGAYTGTTASLCVIAAETIDLGSGSTVGVSGQRPLVLVATATLTIAGTLDVASHRGGQIGPAANATECLVGQAPTNKDGGPGGSFGGRGGSGGGGVLSGAVAASVSTLRGGCAGRAGAGGTQGAGGNGGGAVALIAGTSLLVGGVVNASGAGGGGALDTAGGGGGGSGGMIVLEAPQITVTGEVFANGGGGGEGAGNSNSGNPGADPTSALARAQGGIGGAGAGDGGDGSAGAILTGQAGTLDGSSEGGGGGGGAGVIRVFSTQVPTGTLSPAPS